MSKNAASEERLGSLHAVVADTLIAQLKGLPIYDDDGEEVAREIDPRIISSAITFLNNNKIVANPFLSEKLTELEEQLSKRTKRFKVVDAHKAAEKAAANA